MVAPSHRPSRPPSPWQPASLLATWFGSGLLPGAPGTWGSLAALPCGVLLFWLAGPFGLLAATVAVFAVGLWAAGRYAQAAAVKDPGAVVIDEVAGQWLALIPAGLDPLGILLAFLFFRIFDVTKPWPAGWADRRLEGALGIMVDDIFAGLYAAVVVYGVLRIWGRF